MAYAGILELGGVEIANARRAAVYMEAGVKAPSMDVSDQSWIHTARFLGHQDYRLPALDLAPWYNSTEPDSKEFAGIWPMSIEGLDTAGGRREVIDGLNDGGTFGLSRYSARTIEVEAIIAGSTPAGVDYGLRWLTTTLRGERCLTPLKGQTLEYLSSVPEVAPNMSTEDFAECVAPYRRTLYEVVCTSFPEITERFGTVEGLPGSCAYRVKFTLTAGVPFAFRPPALIATNVTWAGSPVPITWVINGPDPDACTTTVPDTLTDPQVTRATIIRAADSYQLGTFIPLDSKTAIATVPKTALKAGQGDTSLQVTVRAGAKEERLIRVRIGRKPTGSTDTNAITCHLLSEAVIQYLPAGAAITLDGVTGRAWAVDSAGNMMDASPVVAGTNGAPWRPPILPCDSAYVVVADAPGDVSAAASFEVYGSVRET